MVLRLSIVKERILIGSPVLELYPSNQRVRLAIISGQNVRKAEKLSSSTLLELDYFDLLYDKSTTNRSNAIWAYLDN